MEGLLSNFPTENGDSEFQNGVKSLHVKVQSQIAHGKPSFKNCLTENGDSEVQNDLKSSHV